MSNVNPSDYLPAHWTGNARTSAIFATLDAQLEALAENRDQLLDELIPATADSLLSIWEEASGLRPNLTETVDKRRGRLISRLRGQGITTAEMIRSLSKALLGCDAVVTEHPADYAIEVRLAESREDDAEVNGFRAALAEILPAHLAVNVIANYVELRVYTTKQGGTPAEGVLITCDMAENPTAWSRFVTGVSETILGPIPVAQFFIDRAKTAETQCTYNIISPLNLEFTHNPQSVDLNIGPIQSRTVFGIPKQGPWEFGPEDNATEGVTGTVYLAALEDGILGEAWGIAAGGGTDGELLVANPNGGAAYHLTAAFGGGGAGEMIQPIIFGLFTKVSFSVGLGGGRGCDGGDLSVTATHPTGSAETRVGKGGKAAEITFLADGNPGESSSKNGVVVNGGKGSSGGGAAGAAGFNWKSAGAGGVDGSSGGDTSVGDASPCKGKQGLGGEGTPQKPAVPFMFPFSGSILSPVVTWAKDGKSCGNGGPGIALVEIDPDTNADNIQGNAVKVLVQGQLTPSELLYGDGGYTVINDTYDMPKWTAVNGRPGRLVIRLARYAAAEEQEAAK